MERRGNSSVVLQDFKRVKVKIVSIDIDRCEVFVSCF